MPSWGVLRTVTATFLLILVAVLGMSSVLARFARDDLLDTDRYLQAVTPVGSDPEVLGELADRITDAIIARAPAIAAQGRNLVRDTAMSVLTSDQFETLWVQVNRQAHQGVVAVLTGDTPAAIGMDDQGAVSISLTTMIARVRQALIDRGFSAAESIPAIDRSVVLFNAPELVRAQRWVSILDRAADLLPWITLLVAACAVWLTPKGARRKGVSLVGLSLAVAMAFLAIALAVGRAVYLQPASADALSTRAALTVIDALLVHLREALCTVFVLALVVALTGYLAGSARSAIAIRAACARTLSRAGIGPRTSRPNRTP
ncbi:hypothetical protein ACFVUS_26870 [Nocardia sp. NPDC058058]|uniref:hypothetical protein n=1 Tax=Nocardia sp. NPDC058058 TaxID=3346317 RepID=UPI0036DA2732